MQHGDSCMPIHPVSEFDSTNAGTTSRLIDRFRDGAAVIYLEGRLSKHEPVATIVLVDADKHRLVMSRNPVLMLEDGRWLPSVEVPQHAYPSPSFADWPSF